MKGKLNFSKYQKDIFTHVENTNKHLIVEAVAGAGKTVTLLEIANRLSNDCLFSAFSKDVVEKLKKLAPNATVKTVHSLGLKCLSKSTLDKYKYYSLCAEWLKTNKFTKPSSMTTNLTEKLRSTVTLGQMYLAEKSDIIRLLHQHSTLNCLENDQLLVKAYSEICDVGIKLYKDENLIDFSDMVWLPNKLNLLDNLFKFKTVLVDEIQDLSKAEMEILIASVKTKGKFVGVGDPLQNIYAFTGADQGNINWIKRKLEADTLPLPICYRCPSTHIHIAQQFNPLIQCGIERQGTVIHLNLAQYIQQAQPGDLVICRRNLFLVYCALELLKIGKLCEIRGKDIVGNIRNFIREIKTPNPWSTIDYLENLKNYHFQKISNVKNDIELIARLNDTKYCVETLIKANKINKINDLIKIINSLFSNKENSLDNSDNHVILSTIHKAKGMEAKRVIILNRSGMPDENAKTPETMQQECNLLYVAHTRSTDVMIFVEFSHNV